MKTNHLLLKPIAAMLAVSAILMPDILATPKSKAETWVLVYTDLYLKTIKDSFKEKSRTSKYVDVASIVERNGVTYFNLKYKNYKPKNDSWITYYEHISDGENRAECSNKKIVLNKKT